MNRAEPTEKPKPELLSVPDIRALLGGIGTVTVYKLFKENILTRVKIGSRTFAPAEQVKKLSLGGAKW
jgi:hypothetical protein